MSDQLISLSGLERLKRHGNTNNGNRWIDFEFNYVTEFGLTSSDVPSLLNCVHKWLEDFDEDDETAWGPVHAWRALGQMRSVEVIEPLLDMMEELDQSNDDWYLEEFPHVWGMIGEAAIVPLKRYLANDQYLEFPRCAAISGLGDVARHHPETRDQAVEILTAELAKGRSPEDAEENGSLNGSILAALLDLNAVESAETIERAFAANVIDPMIVGDWGAVRKKLSVDGLGLAPDKSPGWVSLRDRMGLSDSLFDTPALPWQNPPKRKLTLEEKTRREQAELKKKRDVAAKAKLKKKKERENRKKGRKAR
ncbi:MAG: hypothetical protein ACI8P0_002446 [Planctomycetaceae bacterium]|jgi:hypothetical protein